jgi:penicillin-binding protein-related factor A (putative recombinase)
MSAQVDPKLKSIANADLNAVHRYYWGIPIIQMCRNMIRQHLFSNGIEYKGKSNQTVQQFSQKIMEDYWLPFCEDALDSAICYGFVVWRVKKIDKHTSVPIVCLKDTFTLKMKETDSSVEYTVYDAQDKENDVIKDAYVYDEFGYRPQINGSLMSVMHTLIPDIQYYFTMLNCQVMLEKKRVKPAILTQLNERSGAGRTGENEGIEYDFYADTDLADAEQEAKFKRNRAAVESLKTQQRLYDDFFDPTDGPEEVQAPAILDQMVPIPSGQTLANYQIQQGRSDLPVILKGLQDTICGVLGVPKSMIMSDTPHKSDAVGTHQMFQMTILWWKRQISEMCEMIYNVIHAKAIADKVGEKMAKKKEINHTEVYMATRNQQSRITFPITPFVTNEELYALYTQGVIEWKTYCVYVTRNVSIPLDIIPPEPLKDKDKKQLLGIHPEAPRSETVKKASDEEDKKASVGEEKKKEQTDNEKDKKKEKADVEKAVGKKRKGLGDEKNVKKKKGK